jgi:type II secretory pathway pseudopilin PulG
MKFILQQRTSSTAAKKRRAGFTLVEVMIAGSVMMMVVAGVLSANFLGLRQSKLMEAKAGASDSSRRYVSQLLYDIKSAKGYDVGTMSGTNFIAITNGSFQGPALRLFIAAISTNQVIDTSRYIIYWFDATQAASGNGMLNRLNSTNGTSKVLLSNLVNTLYFTSENYLGYTQTVRTYKGVIHATLQFTQFQYPLTAVGTNGLFDSYRIDCRATPHIPDGA